MRNNSFFRKVGVWSLAGLCPSDLYPSGASQSKVPKRAEIHPTHVSLIERSCRNPSLIVAQAIADGLGLSLADMIAEAEAIQKRGAGEVKRRAS